MSQTLEKAVTRICQTYNNDATRMMDIVLAVQAEFGCVSNEAITLIARVVAAPRVEVESVVSFYTFLSKEPQGKVVIRLCNDIIDRMSGSARSAQALFEDLGISFGETTPDGSISLQSIPCIGMCDQAPGALINDVVVTHLSSDAVHEIIEELKEDLDPRGLVHTLGSGNNAHELVQSMVANHIREKGPVIFTEGHRQEDQHLGQSLEKALAMSPVEVIREIKTARLRGRGGAGFPTGMKWEFTRAAPGNKRYIICNADEGEPGTFKDRVILTERADLLFEGMAIAGYAVGSDSGILYLRGEYAYLRPFLEHVLEERRAKGLLGDNILGKKGFNFDIRIQMGAGAYICGEESALISSCEGRRGDPKTRPPFPAQKGYLGCPTVVNNVETLCCVARILEKGSGWFSQLGSKGSTGTKLLSVSGDCRIPGIYELPFGTPLREVLRLAGAEDAIAVQVGGPSGQLVGPEDYDRTICYDDLATGGAIMIFGPKRDIPKIADCFMDFFIEESCGYCTPCRVGNVLLKRLLNKIMKGQGEPQDLDRLEKLGQSIKATSRCGLGQTSPNPILTTLKNFRSHYEKLVKENTTGLEPSFDIRAAVARCEAITDRKSVVFSADSQEH